MSAAVAKAVHDGSVNMEKGSKCFQTCMIAGASACMDFDPKNEQHALLIRDLLRSFGACDDFYRTLMQQDMIVVVFPSKMSKTHAAFFFACYRKHTCALAMIEDGGQFQVMKMEYDLILLTRASEELLTKHASHPMEFAKVPKRPLVKKLDFDPMSPCARVVVFPLRQSHQPYEASYRQGAVTFFARVVDRQLLFTSQTPGMATPRFQNHRGGLHMLFRPFGDSYDVPLVFTLVCGVADSLFPPEVRRVFKDLRLFACVAYTRNYVSYLAQQEEGPVVMPFGMQLFLATLGKTAYGPRIVEDLPFEANTQFARVVESIGDDVMSALNLYRTMDRADMLSETHVAFLLPDLLGDFAELEKRYQDFVENVRRVRQKDGDVLKVLRATIHEPRIQCGKCTRRGLQSAGLFPCDVDESNALAPCAACDSALICGDCIVSFHKKKHSKKGKSTGGDEKLLCRACATDAELQNMREAVSASRTTEQTTMKELGLLRDVKQRCEELEASLHIQSQEYNAKTKKLDAEKKLLEEKHQIENKNCAARVADLERLLHQARKDVQQTNGRMKEFQRVTQESIGAMQKKCDEHCTNAARTSVDVKVLHDELKVLDNVERRTVGVNTESSPSPPPIAPQPPPPSFAPPVASRRLPPLLPMVRFAEMRPDRMLVTLLDFELFRMTGHTGQLLENEGGIPMHEFVRYPYVSDLVRKYGLTEESTKWLLWNGLFFEYESIAGVRHDGLIVPASRHH